VRTKKREAKNQKPVPNVRDKKPETRNVTMRTTIPPYLKQGNTIAITAPAGYMPFENMQTCVEKLQEWGYNLKLGDTTHSNSQNYFSGTDDERLKDLQQFLDDDTVHAILCARGGYGLSRIVDRLDFKKFKKRPKWIIGFSDVTVLHSHIYSNYKIASLHAPMAAAFNDKADNDPYILSLKNGLEGKPSEYECNSHEFNIKGKTKGELVGGNLSLLAHLCGTDSDVKTKNKILFLEDVGEYLYNIDRLMLQLKRCGKFYGLSGLVIGGFTESKDTTRPFGKTAYEIIKEQIGAVDFPVCYGFPVSHDSENYALKVGVKYKLEVNPDGTILKEVD
jgi:muramoyltetrapeptide carboxypeptidase